MKLYSGPLSLFTAKVRVALAEKGLPYERVEVPFSRAGYRPKHPEVERINPKAQVPVLVDGDLEIYDSTLILEYLEESHPEPPLAPREPAARARHRRLELEADEVFFPDVWPLVEEVFYQSDPALRDNPRIEQARIRIAAHRARLDARLADRTWLTGEAFTNADVAHLLVDFFATGLGVPLDPAATPRFAAWQARGLARPSVARELEEMSRTSAALVVAGAA